VLCLLLFQTSIATTLYPRWITTEEIPVSPTSPTLFTFQTCYTFNNAVLYEAVVLAPQSSPSAPFPLLSMRILDPDHQELCSAVENSLVSCQFNLIKVGNYTIIIDPIFDDHYKFSVNVQAIEQYGREDNQFLQLSDQSIPSNFTLHSALLVGKLHIDPTPLAELFETSLGPLVVQQNAVLNVTFAFCKKQFGYGFVVTGSTISTELRTLLCPPYVAINTCISHPITENFSTAQTQVISTLSNLEPRTLYYLLFVGRGFTRIPPSTENRFTVVSWLNKSPQLRRKTKLFPK